MTFPENHLREMIRHHNKQLLGDSEYAGPFRTTDGTDYTEEEYAAAVRTIYSTERLNRALAETFPDLLGVLPVSGQVYRPRSMGRTNPAGDPHHMCDLEWDLSLCRLRAYAEELERSGYDKIHEFIGTDTRTRTFALLRACGVFPLPFDDPWSPGDKQTVIRLLEHANVEFDTALPQEFYITVVSSVDAHPYTMFVWTYPSGNVSGLPCPLSALAVQWLVEHGYAYYDVEAGMVVYNRDLRKCLEPGDDDVQA